jgi:hypothetical protein
VSDREWQCLHFLEQAVDALGYKPRGEGSSYDGGDDLHCKYWGEKPITSAWKTVILSLVYLFRLIKG